MPEAANPTDDVMILDERIRPEIVVTATGADQPVDDIGQAITRIDRATIEQRQTVSLSDLLATTPGVTVSRNGGTGTFTGVRIRGAEAEQTLVLIDGVRVNDPSSPGGGFDFGTLLAGSVQRVELLRGPDSVPWGSQAIGGVVNVVTAPATDQLSAHGQIEGGYAGTVYANGAVSAGAGPVRASLAGGYDRTDGISAAAIGRERDGFNQAGAVGRVEVALSDSVGADFRLYYARSHVDLDGFPPPTYTLADTPEYSTSREIYGYAGLHASAFDGRLKNRVDFTIADIHRDNFDPTATPTLEFLARGRSERYSYQGDLDLRHVRLVFGAEHEDSRFTDGFSPASTGITSGYGEAIVKPVAALTLTGGVRYDAHRSFGGHVTFGADAAWRVTHTTLIRASYGEGFKAPTLYQLYSFFGDPALKPETAQSYDIGLEQRAFDGRLRAALTWFHRDTTNQIDFDLATFAYSNIDRTRTQGIEAELELRPVDALTINANYSFIDAINRSAGANFGHQLARRPRQLFNLSADYKLPFGLSFGGTYRHVGDSFDDAGNFRRLNAYDLVDLRAELPIGKHFAVYGRIENVGDARYQTVAGYGTYPRAAYVGVRAKL
ncbi:TonB-dependent receptor plug domain-containing protein [Sphingomonas sp. GlSt437]|uniref:TonB-dependent receptor plug domain-containing protein n=2 Tax=Bacteria TaxID=2 RepID=UPI003A8AA444